MINQLQRSILVKSLPKRKEAESHFIKLYFFYNFGNKSQDCILRVVVLYELKIMLCLVYLALERLHRRMNVSVLLQSGRSRKRLPALPASVDSWTRMLCPKMREQEQEIVM